MIHQLAYSFLMKHVAQTRAPDHIISGEAGLTDPYLLRWYVIPRNPIFNIYLHNFCRSDDDRALHDHPWWNLSWLLHGDYVEEVPHDPKNPQAERKAISRSEGAVVFRLAKQAHRVILHSFYTIDREPIREIPVWTLFLTGPRFRKWGFWCPHSWRFWKDYTENKPGASTIGRGCD